MKKFILASSLLALYSCSITNNAITEKLLDKGLSELKGKGISETIKEDSLSFRGEKLLQEHNFSKSDIKTYFNENWNKKENLNVVTFAKNKKTAKLLKGSQILYSRGENQEFYILNQKESNRIYTFSISPTDKNFNTELENIFNLVLPTADKNEIIFRRDWAFDNGKNMFYNFEQHINDFPNYLKK